MSQCRYEILLCTETKQTNWLKLGSHMTCNSALFQHDYATLTFVL